MKAAGESRLARDCVCDVLVIGSGAGGLSTAVTARLAGLDVVVVEKAAVFGGTTAFSGGVLWIPGNNKGATDSRESRERMVEYLKSETGGFYDDAAIAAFLDKGPEMVSFFELRTAVKFLPTLYPDYHPTRRAAPMSGVRYWRRLSMPRSSGRSCRDCGHRSRPSRSWG